MPVVNKLASIAALLAAALYLDSWLSFIPDLVAFMKVSPLQLRNGIIVL